MASSTPLILMGRWFCDGKAGVCANPERSPPAPKVRACDNPMIHQVFLFLVRASKRVMTLRDVGSRKHMKLVSKFKHLHFFGHPRRKTRVWIETYLGAEKVYLARVTRVVRRGRGLKRTLPVTWSLARRRLKVAWPSIPNIIGHGLKVSSSEKNTAAKNLMHAAFWACRDTAVNVPQTCSTLGSPHPRK